MLYIYGHDNTIYTLKHRNYFFKLKGIGGLSVACFWCQGFGDISPSTFVHITFSQVSVTEWPPFGK